MRYLTAACPRFRRVVLVESGRRAVMERALPNLVRVFGHGATFDLVTCHPGRPGTLPDASTIWRTKDNQGSSGRAHLLRQLGKPRASAVAILCSGDSVMTRWKWWLAFRLPAKVLIVNENADCFWLDAANIGNLRRLLAVRSGMSGEFTARGLLKLASLPVICGYLLLYAGAVHGRRAVRLAWKSL